MNTVYLHGKLGEEFGGPYRLHLDTAKCAIKALGVQLPGFCARVLEGHWRVIRGDIDEGMALGEDDLGVGMGNADLHIIPALGGAGRGGAKALVGAVMVGAAFMIPGMQAAGVSMLAGGGAGIFLAGVTMMLSPTPTSGDYESREKDEQSFLFNGPVNVNKQGVAAPLLYGEVITGSVVISAGITAEDIAIDGSVEDTGSKIGG